MSRQVMAKPDTYPSRRSRRQRWGTVGRSMAMFGLFWVACLLEIIAGSGAISLGIDEPAEPRSTLFVVLTMTAVFGFLLAIVVTPWIGMVMAIWAWRDGGGAKSLVALALNTLTATLVLSVLGLSLAWWASS